MRPRSTTTLFLASLLVLSAEAPTQPPLRDAAWLLNNQSDTVTRTAPTAIGQMLARVRASQAPWWGNEGSAGTNVLHGCVIGSHDADVTTADTFEIVGYPGQATGSQPDLTAGWRRGPYPHPKGQASAILRISFSSPESLPADRDAYLGMRFAPSASNDGLFVHFTRYNKFLQFLYDLPGPRYRASADASDRVMYFFNEPASSASTSALGQPWVVPLVTSPAGVCTAITNQSTQPLSNAAPGLANELSGRNPSCRTAGRGDKPGFYYQYDDVANGSVAFFVGTAATTPQPLSSVFFGAEGLFCLDAATMVLVTIKPADGLGASFINLDVPSSIQAGIAGLDVHWWAVGVTRTVNRMIASGAGVHRF